MRGPSVVNLVVNMPKPSNRLGRIGDQLKQELALLIQNEMRDPRLGMISVLEVRVTKDLAHAAVYFTVLGAEPAGAVAALNNAAGFLRSLIAKNLNLRVTPRLRFVFDESVERGRMLSSLIDEAVAQDAKHDHSGDDSATPDAGNSQSADSSATPNAANSQSGDSSATPNTTPDDDRPQ
jgi:ribosome-binding factor A